MSCTVASGGYFSCCVFRPQFSTTTAVVIALRANFPRSMYKIILLFAVYAIGDRKFSLAFGSLRSIATPATDDAAAWPLALTLTYRTWHYMDLGPTSLAAVVAVDVVGLLTSL